MDYKVSFSERASKEYYASLAWYKERSFQAAENFIKAVNDTLDKIADDPKRYRNTYKNFFEVGLTTYPFAVIYFIDEEVQQVVVMSIFHYKRNPRKKFREK